MRKSFLPLLFMLCASTSGYAQTFLDNLQKTNGGEGKVTVTQSKDIDNLVNGQKTQASAQQKAAADKTPADKAKEGAATGAHKDTAAKDRAVAANSKTKENERGNAAEGKSEKPRSERPNEHPNEHHNERTNERTGEQSEETGTAAVDMSKKVMRGSKKITGYRVQAYAGGNTRNDKMRAQQIGNAIKMKHPDQPVYVHFYSPRWICRVGNYRSYSEAQKMLNSIKAMGYKSATIVKGTITVQN